MNNIFENEDCTIFSDGNITTFHRKDENSNVYVELDYSLTMGKVFVDGNLVSTSRARGYFSYLDYGNYYISEETKDIPIKILKIIKTGNHFLSNCLQLLFSETIVNQVEQYFKFMKNGYSVIVDWQIDDCLLTKFFVPTMEIKDNESEEIFHAFVIDDKVYFTYTFEDYSNLDQFIVSKFQSYNVKHFHCGLDRFSILSTSTHAVNIFHSHTNNEYRIRICKFDFIEEVELSHDIYLSGEWDLDMITEFVFYKALVNDPKKDFIKELNDLDIAIPDGGITKEIIQIYEMATI